ncbi:baseplate J/gp47 family protein [Sphingomonas xinjiangensis]|uniref:Baseplate protein J-like domain-containing protein n=1 Tax=Sphingomonas xinjiangensis TaxID=643568 RepID=A0A840YET9_9SPHN|nr:baseplate J/gp47 family protein [Sphingomonas xinjiangensis]MBB5710815.1 hypothetical protein [Sphingomonas xinjiangensis]
MTEGGLITRWTHQRDRQVRFAPDVFRVDKMLAATAHHAATVPFHDEDGNLSGNWDQILGADQSFALALLATADLPERGKPLAQAIAQARAAKPNEASQRITTLVESMLRLARDLDEWLAPAQTGGRMDRGWAHGLAESALDQVLAPQLQRLFDQVADAEETRLVATTWWECDAEPWKATVREGEVRGISRAVERAWAQRLIHELAETADGFLEDMAGASTRAAAALEERLRSGAHEGHAALIIAFLEIFRHAQVELGTLPERVLDYWLDQLGAEPTPARPDRVLLAAVPRPGARPEVPKGLIIPAGKDAVFVAEERLAVTGAKIVELRVWASDGLSVSRAAPDERGVFAEPVTEPALPVVMLTSPALALSGGTRRLQVRLDCASTPTLPEGVTVAVSTASGWVDVDPCWAVEGDFLLLSVLLPDAFPPIVPQAEMGSPALMLTARAAVPVQIDRASVQVSVRDVPGLVVSTSAGQASETAAAPFGTPPFAGGWLRIDHPALAGPPLERLVLRFEWASVPTGELGFASHYHGYVVDDEGHLLDQTPYDNAAFTVTLKAPVPGWDATRQLPLFAPATLGCALPVAAVPPPDILSASFDDAPTLMPAEGRVATNSWLAASGASGVTDADHVLVTLASPLEAFGHSLFAANVQWATEAIARTEMPGRRPGLIRRLLRALLGLPKTIGAKLSARQSVKPDPVQDAIPIVLPNPPFQPMLSRISLDHAAAAQPLTMFHVPPLEAPTKAGAGPLFPTPLVQSALEVVIDDIGAATALTLLWQVGSAGSPPGWWYLSLQGWAPLPALEDGTAGLSASGILRVTVPADIAPGAFRMQARFTGALPKIVAVLPDAFPAHRSSYGTSALQTVAAGTITEAVSLQNVTALVQPMPSTGGAPREADEAVRARVIERVRHGGRAQSRWDIERMVLTAFPEIVRVRVVPGSAGVTVLVEADAQMRAAIAGWLNERASPFAKIAVTRPLSVPVDVSAELAGAGDIAAVERAVRALIEDELSLDDLAGAEEVRAAILRLLLAHPEVQTIERLRVSLGEGFSPWRVPVAGTISIAAVEGATQW